MSDLNFSDVASDAKATEEVEAVEAVDSQNVETDEAEFNEIAVEDALEAEAEVVEAEACLLYTSPSPRDRTRPRMPSSA